MRRLHFKGIRRPAGAAREASFPGLRRSLLIVASVGAIIAVVDRHRGASMESAMHAEGETIRAKLATASPGPDAPSKLPAAFHWGQLQDLLSHGMRRVGFTERQTQVGMGMLCQKGYQEIAEEAHLDESTVRQHAASAFQKVGCTKKSEFMASLLARMEAEDAR